MLIIADDLADLPEDLFPTNRSQAKTDIHQAQHVEVIQALDPVAILIEFAGGVDSADHCAHGTTGNAGDVVAAFFDFLNDADMGIAPGSTGAQHQCDTLFHDRPRLNGSTMHPSRGALQSPRSLDEAARVVFSTLHGGRWLSSPTL
jgi:hypothetical protein